MSKIDDSLLLMLRNCTNLPSPPAVASKIIELSTCQTACLGDVADVVGLDPALSAKLLRMANSPLYAKHRTIENLRQAITLFGLDGTLNISLSFTLKNTSDNNSESGLDYNMFWKRSLAAAMLCQEVAAKLDNGSKDSAFLIGLLQDIGMLALDKAKPDLYKNISEKQQQHFRICEHEYATLGVDHSAVGAWLLAEWNLPENLIEPIAESHFALSDNDSSTKSDLAIAVVCSCLLADIFITDDVHINRAILFAVEKSEKISNISRPEFRSIIEKVSDNFCDVANMFDIKLDNPQLLELISDQAKEVLILRNLNQIKETQDLQESAKQLESKAIELEEVSRRDSLTKLYNRRHFEEVLSTEFTDAQKHDWPLGLIYIDLDYFKHVNDTYGHAAGDEVLAHTAKLLLKCTRNSDTVARFGGEEFTILLPGTNENGVIVTCERIVNAFHEQPISLASGESIQLTVSAGASVLHKEDAIANYSAFMANADAAVYQAKASGRDQFIIFDPRQVCSKNKVAS